jgi:large subunit ribosomal protein L3
MGKAILGRKLGMTGVFGNDGAYVPVTVIEAGPCVVTQIKTEVTDGYNALQIGFREKRADKVNKPLAGHFKKSGAVGFSYVREIPVEEPSTYSLGQELTVEEFTVGEKVNVTGTTKGRGFSGVVKRYGFKIGRRSHGNRNYRKPGAIGNSAWPGKVARSKKLPGQYGNSRKTVKNLIIHDIREAESLILVKGAVPGSKNSLVQLMATVK